MAIPLDQIANMPAFSPYYPMPPARYRNVKFHFVYFRAHLDAIHRVLPDCFEAHRRRFLRRLRPHRALGRQLRRF